MTGRPRKPGAMGPFIEGYRAWLTTRGYSPGTVIHLLAMAGALGRWMNTGDIAVGDLHRAVITEFRSARRASGMRWVPGAHGLDPLLEFLGQQGVGAVPTRAGGPIEELVGCYRRWLVGERGLAEATVLRYVKLARLFLTQHSAGSLPALEKLSGTDIVAFLLQGSERLSVGSVKGRVAELRSLLTFLYLHGLTPRLLSTVVPPVAGWRDSGVPKAIPAADLALLLGSCDRHDSTGVRDFAILMLVARLGVRSVEVARLRLEDIDWRAGQIILRGKASSQEGMPLPVDVGQALSAYLKQARPPTRIRNVFLAAKAPMRPIPPGLVADVTHRACDRAGLHRIGAHRLRHSLATDMLLRGATIVEVSQVLRHRDLATTAIYAMVDDTALRAVARSWPGALSDAARDYLRLRNRLGHELAEHHRELPRFVAVLDAAGLPTVTVAAALAWAQEPGVDPASSVAARRMTIARYMAGIDARTEVPPPGLISGRRRWRPPFIYSPDDIAMLMAQARRLRQPMPAATHETLIGLLAASGIRVGEAIGLGRDDIDWARGVLVIRESKFGKSRRVPVLESTLTALDRYARTRDQFYARTTSSSFFVSMTGTRVIYRIVQQTFRRLCDSAGIGADTAAPPRIHNLRHSFAIRTLLDWYRSGADVEAQLPMLSTYLGHRDPRSTYWYLSAAPELLALAAQRLESSQEVTTR